jgi:hypothetical protein
MLNDSNKPRGFDWSIILLVVASTLIMVVLSRLFIGSKSFTIDEAASFYFARNWWSKREANMLLYYMLLSPWMRLGNSEAIIRAMSAVFAVATIPAIFFLGRRLFGPRAGAFAALMVAFNTYFISYAQTARGYTLLVLLVTLGAFFFIRAVQVASWKNWLGCALCDALAFYTHFFAVLVYVAHALSLPLLGRRKFPWRGFAFSTLVLMILVTPLVILTPWNTGQIDWLPPPSLSDVYSYFVYITGSRLLLLFYFISCSITLLLVLRRSLREGGPYELWNHLFVAIWALAPVTATFVFSWIVKPVFQTRFLIVSLPALPLLAGAGIARLKRPWLQAAVLTVMLCLSARSITKWYGEFTTEDWRNSTRYVLSTAHPGDGAIFYSFWGIHPFSYYQDRIGNKQGGPTVVDLSLPPPGHGKAVKHLNEPLLSSLASKYDNLYFILCYDTSFRGDPDKDEILATIERNYTKVEEREFPFTHNRILVLRYSRMSPKAGGYSRPETSPQPK